jgi:hypothetical protein
MPYKTNKKQKRQMKSKHTAKKQHQLLGGAKYDSDTLAAKYASCTSADRHNLQTGEANLDLINGAGVVPAGQTGGATNGSCPGNGQLLSFKDYANNIATRLGVDAAYPSADAAAPQMGGGYAIDPSAEQIGGQPGRVGYSDCCPPVSLEGRLLMGANSGAVCGQQAGGAKHRKSRKKTKRTLKKHKKHTKMTKMTQLGGDSVPAAFPAESHSGADGDFSDHGPQLHYDGRQPFWDATTR